MYSRWTDKGDLSLGGATAQGTWKIEIDRKTKDCEVIVCEVNPVGTTLIPPKELKRERRKGALPPGTWLAMLIAVATFGFVAPCSGCKSRTRTMDRAGWRGLPFLFWIKSIQLLGVNHGYQSLGRVSQR